MNIKLKLILFSILLLFIAGCGGGPTDQDFEFNGTMITQDYIRQCSLKTFGDDCYTVNKFGHSETIGTSLTPVTSDNVYKTPKTLTSLEILSNSVLDNSTGSGGRKVLVQGISTNWTQIEEIVILDGTNVVALSNQFYRVYRMYLTESGTYANETAGSHTGTITLRESGGGDTWASIQLNGFALGQSEIGVYTIPDGYTGYLQSVFMHVAGNKEADIYFFERPHANQTTSPYHPMRVIFQVHGITETETFSLSGYSKSYSQHTDIGFMAETDTGTTGVGVNFELLLIRNG